MPTKATTTSAAPAKVSSRRKGGKTYKITLYVTSDDTYLSTPKKVAESIENSYWLGDYFTDWTASIEKATAEDLEAAL